VIVYIDDENGEDERLRNARQSATQVSAYAALVPQTERAGIIDDAESGDRSHQQDAADDEEDARGAGLRHLQNDERITRRQQHGCGKRQHPDPSQQAGHILGPAACGVILRKEVEPIGDQPRNDDEIRHNRYPGFCVHNLDWTRWTWRGL
jgi:hypothetical protein